MTVFGVDVCRLCVKRHEKSALIADDSDFEVWSRSSQSCSDAAVCPNCFGLLQFGLDLVEQFRASWDSAGYLDIYSCQLSLQLPALMVFRGFLERLIVESMSSSGQSFVDVKDVLRQLLSRLITENPDDRMPKLFCDVQFVSPVEFDEVGTRKSNLLAEMPMDIVSAINHQVKTGGDRFKKFKDKHCITVADVTSLLSKAKTITDMYKVLYPKVSETPDEETVRQSLVSNFFAVPAAVYVPKIGFRRETLYLVGKYRKTCREFGQSQWDANSTSVAESIVPSVCEMFGSPVDKCLFSASGREDMDVRMLGEGRTFVLQVGDAKNLHAIQNGAADLRNYTLDTGDVQVFGGLRYVDKGVLDWLHWSTEQHVKVYRCVIWSSEKFPSALTEIVSKIKDQKVFQKTPLRVLHRRSENVREKFVHTMEIEKLNDHYALVTLHASAGAYIKEFIHGDFGRTSPSFTDLVFGKDFTESAPKCDILQLDVLEVKQNEEEEYVPLWERQ